MHTVTRTFFSVLLTFAGATAGRGVDTPPAPPAPPALRAAAPVTAPVTAPVAAPIAAPIAAEAAVLGPRIQFATPIYDFGKVEAGELVKYSYVFTNSGDQPLEVSNVQPSCGCTTAGDWSRKVMPGETGMVPIQFNSSHFNGQVFKTISVTSNEKQKPVTVLQLKGAIWKPIELLPQNTVINLTPDASQASASVRIINHLDAPLTVSSPECSNPSFSIALITNQPGKEFQVTIASVGELNTGNVQGKVTLKTSSSKTPTLEVPFWVIVQPVISIMPPRITLPQGPLKAKAPTTVTIQNNSTNALILNDPAVNIPGVEVQIKEVQPGRIFQALLTFPDGLELPSGQPITLTLKSSQPRMPEIRVPISQVPRPVTVQPTVPKPSAPTASGAANPAVSAQATR